MVRSLRSSSDVQRRYVALRVGELEIFRDEDIEHARRNACAGISVELRVHPGAPHVFDLIAPHSDLVRRCRADRARAIVVL